MSINLAYNSALKQKLGTIPEQMLEEAFKVVMQQAHLMKGLAQVFVRVDTGSLRDSIRVERGGRGKRWRTVRVRAGGYKTNPKTGRRVDYAIHVEHDYPYMRPAWEQVRPNLEMLLRAGLLEAE